MKKTAFSLILLLVLSFTLVGCGKKVEENNSLPKPEVTDGIRGEQFGIDKNINEETIDNYLGREDTVYRDM